MFQSFSDLRKSQGNMNKTVYVAIRDMSGCREWLTESCLRSLDPKNAKEFATVNEAIVGIANHAAIFNITGGWNIMRRTYSSAFTETTLS